MPYDRPYCFVALFVGLRRGDWLCGVQDRVDLIVYMYRVLFVVCGGFWVEFGRFVTFITELCQSANLS